MAGNATLSLYDGSGYTDYDVWMVSLSTSSNNQFASQQTHHGMWWSPIRRAETFIQITCIWPLIGSSLKINSGFEGIDPHDGFKRMNVLQDAIHSHQMQIIAGQTTNPMVINYWNNNAQSPIFNELISKPGDLTPLIYKGWIRSVEKQFDKSKNVFYTNYYMNILTHPNPNSSSPTTSITAEVTYAPTAYDQNAYGSGWLNIPAMQKQIPNVAP